MNDNIQKKYKICDYKGNTIVNDIKKNFRLDIHKHKLKQPFLTFDDKYFINPVSKKFTIIESDDDELISFDIKKFEGCDVVTLSDLLYTLDISDDEFDKEIKKYDIVIDEGFDKIYKVCDNDGNILVNDEKKQIKIMLQNHMLTKPIISFDNKYFINPNSKRFVISKNDTDDEIIPFDLNKFKDYSIVTLRELNSASQLSDEDFNNEINKYDIIFDYDLKGIDPEVKKLVYAFNNCGLDIVTVGSCSGHDVVPLWVSFKIKKYKDIYDIVMLINDKFTNKCFLTTQDTSYQSDEKCNELLLRFVTEEKGQKAYELADEFADALLKNK